MLVLLKLKPLPELLAQYLARRGLGDPVDEDHLADLLVVDHLEHTLGYVKRRGGSWEES